MFWKLAAEEGVEVSAEDSTAIDPGLRSFVSDNGGTKTSPRKISHIGNMKVQDHFSLSNPSSSVNFGEDEALIFFHSNSQTTLEKKRGSDVIIAKQADLGSAGLIFTRFVYTLVAFLMAGFVFIFCIQIVLFLFLGLAIESGLTSKQGIDVFTFIGTLFSIPVFISALSQIMTIATTFVLDTWNGSKFMKTITSWDSTLVDWLTLFVFLGFPILIGAISLCTGTGAWWQITSISWFVLVLLYFAVFACAAVYYEVDGCLELVRYHPKFRDLHSIDDDERTKSSVMRAFVLRMKQRLSGHVHVTFVSAGEDTNPERLSFNDVRTKDSFKSQTGLFSRLTRQKWLTGFLYTVLDKPVREYSVDEVIEFTPYVTRSSWGLESMYCRNRDTRFITIIDGEGSLTKGQVRSSKMCFGLGTLLTLFLIVSFLAWMDVPSGGIVVVVLMYALSVFGQVRQAIGLNAAYSSILSKDDNVDRSIESKSIYQVKETFRITEPKMICYWIVLAMDIGLFFLIPLIALFVAGNYNVGAVFIFLGVVTCIRNIFSAPAVLRELGSLDGIEVNNKNLDGMSEWREKHRLSKIVSEISVGKRSSFWTKVFLFFVLTFCAIFLSAVALGTDEGASDKITFLPATEFFYEGSGSLNYASCSMGRNIDTPDGSIEHSLADFTFLSTVAYLDDDSAETALAEWFNGIPVENFSSNVTDFKLAYNNDSSAVSYKHLGFDNGLNIVAVRGTSNAWDALTDAQLWSMAALAQYVRALMPLGEWWTSILPHLVKAVSVIEAKSLEDVSYYKETSAYVRSLKAKNLNVLIVGHSLGGGLAMITGAQEKIPAVGVSGPNNEISRLTFNPPISVDALNKYTFNIVPDRDPVPRIDDLSENYQRVQCRSAPNAPVDCHFGKRTLCEIMFTCGTAQERPIPCFCFKEYGYELPTSVGGASVDEYCVAEE